MSKSHQHSICGPNAIVPRSKPFKQRHQRCNGSDTRDTRMISANFVRFQGIRHAVCSLLLLKIMIVLLVIVGQKSIVETCPHATAPSFVSLDSPNNMRYGEMGIEEGTGKERVLLATWVSANNKRCEAAPAPYTTQRRAQTFSMSMQKPRTPVHGKSSQVEKNKLSNSAMKTSIY